jgi:hypothetical protein
MWPANRWPTKSRRVVLRPGGNVTDVTLVHEPAVDVHRDRPVDAGVVSRFRRGLAGGVLAGALRGLADALDDRPKKDEAPIVQEADEPVDDVPIAVHIVEGHPGASWAEVRAR